MTVQIGTSKAPEGTKGEGWTIRAYREGDIPGIAEVMNAANAEDGIERLMTVDDLMMEFAMPISDPPRQVIVAESEAGALVGYGRIIGIDDESSGERLYQFNLKVHPGAREQGLDEALVERLMAMARAHNSEPGRAPAEKVSILSIARANQTSRQELLEKIGLQNVRYSWVMERPLGDDLPEPGPVEGVSVRNYRHPADNVAAHKAYNNSFIDHFEFHELPQEFWDFQIGRPEMKYDLSWLAEAEDEPGRFVGFCICEVKECDNQLTGRKEGWIGLLGTVRGWRGKGLGRSLLLRGLRSLKETGMETALLGVDSESPTGANRLYESVGFTVRFVEVLYKCELGEITI